MATRTEIVLTALGLVIEDRRLGRAWLTCPFHGSGSRFFVRLEGKRAGQNHCFSCKSGGSLAALVEHVRRCDRKAAAHFIEQALRGFRVPVARARVVDRKSVLVRPGLRFSKEVDFGPYASWVSGARRYLEGKRGLGAADVERFGLGYAAEGYLAGRIVFPCRDARGRIVNYSARTFVDEEPRYKTPREGDHADASAIFGAHLWPPLEARRAIVISEGAVDAVTAAKIAGVVVGSIGGSDDVDPNALAALSTFPLVAIMTDNDPAGKRAAASLRMMLGRHVAAVRIELPPGSDANKLAREDPELLRRTIARALGASAPLSEGEEETCQAG